MTEIKPQLTLGQKIIVVIVIFTIVFGVTFTITYFLLTPSSPSIDIAQIRIESDTSWSGSIGSLEEGYRTVEGSDDQTFNVEGSIISCSIQKQTTHGYLRISIIKNGKVVKTQQTTAEYGVVTIAD